MTNNTIRHLLFVNNASVSFSPVHGLFEISSVYNYCKMLKSSIFLAIVAISSVVHAWEDCGSEVGSLIALSVSGCVEDKRCIFKRNTNETINIQFKSDVDTETLKAVVHGVILSVAVPFSLPNPDGCVDSGVQCPVVKGTSYNYTNSLPVLQTYPKVTVDVKWELQDQDGKNLVCVLIPAKIQ